MVTTLTSPRCVIMRRCRKSTPLPRLAGCPREATPRYGDLSANSFRFVHRHERSHGAVVTSHDGARPARHTHLGEASSREQARGFAHRNAGAPVAFDRHDFASTRQQPCFQPRPSGRLCVASPPLTDLRDLIINVRRQPLFIDTMGKSPPLGQCHRRSSRLAWPASWLSGFETPCAAGQAIYGNSENASLISL